MNKELKQAVIYLVVFAAVIAILIGGFILLKNAGIINPYLAHA